MADFPHAHWLGELIPHKTPITTFGCPIHGFLVENATNVEETRNWLAATVYAVGEFHDDGTHHYEVTAVQFDATSGNSPPSWPTDGSSVWDHNVQWTDKGPAGNQPGVYDTQGGTKEHDPFVSGLTADHQSHNSCQLLQVPEVPDVTRSTAEQASDAANKFHWRNYALMVNNWLHGKQLYWPAFANENVKHGFIYVDGNGNRWGIEVQVRDVQVTANWQVQVWAMAQFGHVARSIPDQSYNGEGIARGFFVQLASIVVNSSQAVLSTLADYKVENTTGFALSRNSNGSVVFVHLYERHPTEGVFRDDNGDAYVLRAVVKLEMSGDGTVYYDDGLEMNQVSGLSCTASLYKDKNAVKVVDNVVVGVDNHFHPYIGETYNTTLSYIPVTPDCENVNPISGHEYHYSAIDILLPDQDRTQNRTTHLWRCAFDENDSVVEIAYRKTTGTYNEGEITFSPLERTTMFDYTGNWINSGGECIPDPNWIDAPYAYSDTGPTSTSLVIDAGTEENYQLLRNGAVIDGITIRQNTHRDCSFTGMSDRENNVFVDEAVPYESYGYTQYQLVDGEQSANSYTVHPHIYSLDVVGLIFKNNTDDTYKLSAVATPGGSDATHKGVFLPPGPTVTGFPLLSGAYDPKNKTVVWNVKGLTDLGEGNTFSYV